MTGERGPNEASQPERISDAIESLAAELAGLHRRDTGGVVEYALSGSVFAAREGEQVSFRLRPDVAAAALGTPGTVRSPRGSDWVTLAPGAVDAFVLDRVRAWFENAWRLAGESPEGRPRPH